jgi:DNA-binding transcriptional LysR family regulator
MIQPQVLRYFAEVARTGSLRQASEVFFIAPSAISKQIGNLEKALGTELFDRSPRGMVLTAAGHALRAFVAESEVRIDILRSSIDDLSSMRRGTVRIALVEAAVQSMVPDILTEFTREYPGIRFHLEVCGTARIVEALVHQSADIGMAFNVLNRDDVTLHGRSVQPLQLICRPEHPLADRKTVSMNELAGVRAALPGSSFGIRYLIDQAAAAAGIELDMVYEANSLQTLKNLVRRSDLISFMPPLTFVHEAELGWLRAIPLSERDSETATIDVITARNRKLSAAAAAFLAHVLRHLRARGSSDG